MSKPSIDVLRLPLEKRAEIAFKVAVAKAIKQDKQFKTTKIAVLPFAFAS